MLRPTRTFSGNEVIKKNGIHSSSCIWLLKIYGHLEVQGESAVGDDKFYNVG